MPTLSIQPNERVTFAIRHQDAALLVADKPAHLVTQPGKGHERDTLLNGLFARWGTQLQNLGASRDFGLLHRLDRETSGLLVVALTTGAYDALREAFESRAVRKFYWAVTSKAPSPPEGVIERPLAEFEGEPRGARGPRAGAMKLARVSARGKDAATAYRVIQSAPHGALVECRPITGRLHQVRVHLESIGCPIVGDGLYGGSTERGSGTRLALHAHRLVFPHPATGAAVDVRSPFPKDLRALLTRLKLARPDAAQ